MWYNNLINAGTLELTEEPNNTKLYCHRTASFRCSAKGTPTPHIFWFRNGDSVNATADPRFKIVQHEGDITSSTLFLYGVQSRDFGYYTCVAANEIARITRHAYLVVLGEWATCDYGNRLITSKLTCYHGSRSVTINCNLCNVSLAWHESVWRASYCRFPLCPVQTTEGV